MQIDSAVYWRNEKLSHKLISAVQVSAPISPSGSRAAFVWKLLTAFSVVGSHSAFVVAQAAIL